MLFAWTLLNLEFKYVFFSRFPIPLDPMGFRWSKIAPGRFLASQVSSEPNFSPNFFPRPSNRRLKKFQSWYSSISPKHPTCCVFWKNMTSYLCDFIFRGHFPLGRRIFSRPLFLLVNCIMKIIRIGGHSKKKRLNFFDQVMTSCTFWKFYDVMWSLDFIWRHIYFGNFMTSCDP